MNKPRIFTTLFSSVYPLYVQKAENKGRTRAEVDQIIFWLTGYDEARLNHLDSNATVEDFFENAPQMNPKASLITGVICGYRVEEIEDAVMRKIRYLDKLIDELAKGKSMGKNIEKMTALFLLTEVWPFNKRQYQQFHAQAAWLNSLPPVFFMGQMPMSRRL